ncbi:hybrid sensor histidine kinase/response regulator [Mesoterricola sediminis]|uniref:histidine kinase n=1 Tax=Mesoterricola sediminis TaxID=2927980 RepID=A0AA48GZB1_9BACT|nr:PAS domain S-box protein [Mesoterricola sediminis]BDU76802.1 hypothetical protein METESE_17600 [Mesoterricola sediminis]
MKVTSRLSLLSALSLGILVAMVVAVAWGTQDFRQAKAGYALASELKIAVLEGNAIRDQYFLHREARHRDLWLASLGRAEGLLARAEPRFTGGADPDLVDEIRDDLGASGAIFRRIVDNTAALQGAGERKAVFEELDRRLSSQMLLRGGYAFDSASALVEAWEGRVEATYRNLAVLACGFAAGLALSAILILRHTVRTIRGRLLPLHAGVNQVAGGDLACRLPADGSDEFSDLARAINAMTERLEASQRLLGEEIRRRMLAQARQESEARFKAWFDIPLVGISVTTPEKGWLEVNPHHCAMLGYTREELMRMSWADVTHPEDLPAELEVFERVLAGDLEGYTREKRFIRKDGTILHAELARRCIRRPDGSVEALVGVVLDVSERKRAEEEQRRLTEQLQQSQKLDSLGSLAGGVAHDMNNVLGAILSLATAHLELQEPGKPVHKAFETIAKAATRGRDLVARLLGFARRSLAREAELDLNALVREVAGILERTTLGRVRVELDLAPDAPLILGDGGALATALMNVCVNGVEAMPGGGLLTLRTLVGDGGWTEVHVEDTGTGMPKEILDRALDPFFTTKEVGKATGLGLSLVYTTVKAHRGRLELRSEPGRGTRVRLAFPPCAPAPPSREPAPSESRTVACRRVLLVDDDPLVREATASLLDILGVEAFLASDGAEALARLEAGLDPDVVILDMNMPGLDGAATLPRLRELRPGLPVLLATGRMDQSALDLAEAYPGVALMSKPFTADELRRALG